MYHLPITNTSQELEPPRIFFTAYFGLVACLARLFTYGGWCQVAGTSCYLRATLLLPMIKLFGSRYNSNKVRRGTVVWQRRHYMISAAPFHYAHPSEGIKCSIFTCPDPQTTAIYKVNISPSPQIVPSPESCQTAPHTLIVYCLYST